VGLLLEGTTDERFLPAVVERTIVELLLREGRGDYEVFCEVMGNDPGLTFVESVVQAAKKGVNEFGIEVLCVHADSDAPTSERAYGAKIGPARSQLVQLDARTHCQNLVALVPVQETESWMLADLDLLKREIGTDKTNAELNLARPPEKIARPKEAIAEAIRIARSEIGKRRRRDLSIADLYLRLGQQVQIEQLGQLKSFEDFVKNLREVLQQLNYIARPR
jgi:hypothetical protein